MPHIIVQATPNVVIEHPNSLLEALNTTMWETGEFSKTEDIKARIMAIDTYRVGLNFEPQSQGFVYVQLRLMQGRSIEVRDKLADKLLQTLQTAIAPAISPDLNIQFCVEVVELSDVYKSA